MSVTGVIQTKHLEDSLHDHKIIVVNGSEVTHVALDIFDDMHAAQTMVNASDPNARPRFREAPVSLSFTSPANGGEEYVGHIWDEVSIRLHTNSPSRRAP